MTADRIAADARADHRPPGGGLRRLRLAALNIDGVLLSDSFSPVIRAFVESRGGRYTAELEHRVFSQNRERAARALAEALPGLTAAEVPAAYFREREEYLAAHPMTVMPGTLPLLRRLRRLGLPFVCYGGLDRDHFDRYLGPHADLFTEPAYICTDKIRPGLREIAERFDLDPGEILFVDDVARVAEAALELGACFIGHPSTLPHNHQAARMRESGIRHIVDSLDAIDEDLLIRIDREGTDPVA